MKTMTRSLRQLALVGSALFLLAAGPGRAGAAFTLTLSQGNGSLLVNGAGTINTTGLIFDVNSQVPGAIGPSAGILLAGPTPFSNASVYYMGGLSGPTAFGAGANVYASSGSGGVAGIQGNGPYLFVPQGYASGALLTDSATFIGASFASIGFTPGTYTYTWGTGLNADSLTVTSVVPEPSTWAAVLGGTGLLGIVLRQRRVSLP